MAVNNRKWLVNGCRYLLLNGFAGIFRLPAYEQYSNNNEHGADDLFNNNRLPQEKMRL